MPHRSFVVGLLALAGTAGALAQHEGGGHADETNIFNADIGNAIITFIIFGLVVLILGRFAWRPLLNVLHERERTIRESLESAQRERQQAEQLLAEYKDQIHQARVEATAIVEEGRRDAEAVRRRIQAEARQQADELIARAKREIKLAADTAVRGLYDQTAELAVRVAGNILGREISAEEHRQLVADSLKEMDRPDQARLN